MNRQNDVRKENSMKRKNYFSLLSCMLGALLFGNTLFPTLTVTAQEKTKAGSTAEYRNEETNELRTIFWADGITPPKMGGDDSDFKKNGAQNRECTLCGIYRAIQSRQRMV